MLDAPRSTVILIFVVLMTFLTGALLSLTSAQNPEAAPRIEGNESPVYQAFYVEDVLGK